MRDPADELRELEDEGLRRRLRRIETRAGPRIEMEGRSLLNFSSNDYLGRADSPEWRDLLLENVRLHGAGSGASRLVSGTTAPHLELEERLAELKRTEAALTFSSGFAVASGVIPALCQRGDVIILDKLSHACLIDGARFSGATLRVFPHNDTEKLRGHLRWARSRINDAGRILVVTESVFSMDGDRCPLADIVDAKDEAGALLLLDEAHAFGVIGPEGRGLAAETGLEDRVDLHMGTFSKAVGLSGGYLCSRRVLVDLLVNRARSFIYSTAPPPAFAATLREAIDWIAGSGGDSARETLRDRIVLFDPAAESAIVPHVIGSSEAALAASDRLLERGFLVPAIRYPTVPRNTARLRVTLTSAHEASQVESLKETLAAIERRETVPEP